MDVVVSQENALELSGHEYKTTLGKWNYGYRCAKCAAINNMGEANPNWNPDREAVKNNKKVWPAGRNLLRAGVSNKHRLASEKVMSILQYDWSDLRKHMECNPNWNECKDCQWHIDHIFPIKAFTDYGINDPKIINALDNLRPIAAEINYRKNKFYDAVEFEKYLTDRGILWQKKTVTTPLTSRY